MDNTKIINELKLKSNKDLVQKYLDSFDNIEVEQIKSLGNLFNKFSDYEITSSCYIDDEERIVESIQLIPKKKEKIEIKKEINFNEIDKSDIKNVYFIKSLVKLVQNIDYLSPYELLVLNFVFDYLNFYEGVICYPIEINNELHFPIKKNQKVK